MTIRAIRKILMEKGLTLKKVFLGFRGSHVILVVLDYR